ncbi:restriction endonuclease subunit S [Streptococcus lactarius]|uniref:Restriction endonuclease n=1 Tax=Streptococcus lactarius TaxID=684066 RepID=A0A9X0WNS7_9STRE|nr:restriction endonuclease subunit S [Streptococcus lactarius]MBK4779099.1 restriction endonuclease [Streptococcus lactarius]QUB39479.1 restriction endonuclease subunit S [Streptococcus lactarius]
MSEFKTYTIEQLCIVGSSKRVHLSDYVQQGVPFYRSKEVIELSSGKNISEQLFISPEKYSEIKSKFPVPQENDVLITAVGTIGEILVVKDPNFYFKDGNLIWLRNINFDIIDIDYLYYFLKSDLFQKTIKYNNIGAVQKALTIDFLKTVKITLPSLDNQRKLISVLKSIDKKLKINNQINQELEAMAKILYDYWFVQFDFPDQNGKPYKSSGGKMVYNPELKREIPEGWGVAKIEDIAQTGSGGTPKSTNVSYYSNGEIPWINSGELEQTVITSTSNFITEEGLNNSSAKLFPSGTILVAMYGATAGKVSFLTFEASTNQAICAIMLNDIRMRYYLKNVIEDLYQYLVKLSTGSARDNLSQDMIKNIKVVIPSNDILDRYYDFSNNIIKEITKKQQENEQLTQLRDWLLPMLMNGQVKVG